MHKLSLVLLAIAILLIGTPATAADDWEECAHNQDAQTIIMACTRIIASGKAKGRVLAEIYHHRAVGWALIQDFEQTLTDMDEVIRLDGGDAHSFFVRGVALSRMRQFDRAISDYDQAIRLNLRTTTLETSTIYNERGLAFYLKGDYNRAIGDFDQAIRLDPKVASFHRNRGNAWHAKGDDVRAKTDLERALRLEGKL
jgi:tetratricopeptide (TPR) repeat protein